ncbi:MAG: lactate permease LctP family transporter [Bryobacterales bacterium]|nr:lactate permease LctP family transporter [Bryobacterales bacterium]
MWPQNYTPVAGNLAVSALAAAVPLFTLLFLLTAKRAPAWKAALSGLGAALLIALAVYRMPAGLAVNAVLCGAAFGLLPIGWIVFAAILLYRIVVDTGKFEIIKDSIGSLTEDRRLQALLVAFSFGAFLEGAAGFGAPVAVAAAMLTGLGFSPFYAAAICLLANTAPVAFGSIGTPIITLEAVTGLPILRLSAGVGRICAPISVLVPAYLIGVMGGWKAMRRVVPAILACGVSFALTQLLVSNFLGPQLTDILGSLASMGTLVLLLCYWKPKDGFTLEGEHSVAHAATRHGARKVALAWAPYAILVVMVLLWGMYKAPLGKTTVVFPWPGLHAQVQQMPPVVAAPAPYRAVYRFEWLAAAGTSCFFASILSAMLLGVSPRRFLGILAATAKQLFLPELTIASVLALAYLMNYCGATATLGLAFSATGVLFPFFSAMLGWLGVFLTGSDTSANALFGNLQVVTAGRLGLNPVLMAAANSSGGVMGKMISLQSIAVAAAATGMAPSEEAKLFRFTLRHSIILAVAIGLIVVFYAYVMPGWAP